MASYLKSIFFGRESNISSKSSSRRSITPKATHSQTSESAAPSTASFPAKSKHFNYLYTEPGSVPPASILPNARERSSSASTSRAHAPSPLRFTYDNQISGETPDVCPNITTHQKSYSIDEPASKLPLYRTSSHKAGERPTLTQHPAFSTTSSVASIWSSNQSIYSINANTHRPPTSRASSSGSVATQSTGHEPKSVLKHNVSGGDDSKSRQHAHVSFQNPNRPTPVHMHPLLSYGRIHRAPISFNVIYPPSSRSVVDRHTHSPIPHCTLTQSATEPPTYGQFTLKCDKFPWEIRAKAGADVTASTSVGSSSGKRFYIGTTPSSSNSRAFPDFITNLDILHAIHVTLSARVTQTEWDSLGTGSRVQCKASRAYEKRCTDMGGGWGAGVRRVDFLGGRTKLVGIEIATEKMAGEITIMGKLIFTRP